MPTGQGGGGGGGQVDTVADIAARNALTPSESDICKVLDAGSGDPATYTYDGTTWIDISEGAGGTLDGMSDTNISSLADNETIRYDDGSGKWINSSTVNLVGVAASTAFQLAGTTVTSIKDEDNMASDDDAALATQQSIKAYTDTQIATRAASAHAIDHVTGGADVITAAVAAGASGLMTGADKTKLDGIDAGADVTGSNAPQAHDASHENGGGDELNVAGLSGLLADDQHVLDTEVVSAIEAEQAMYANGNSGATPTINCANGRNQSIVLNAATVTFTVPSNPVAGQGYRLKLIQDGSGSRDPVFTTWDIKWEGATEPTWSTGADDVDILTLWYDGTNWYGGALLDMG